MRCLSSKWNRLAARPQVPLCDPHFTDLDRAVPYAAQPDIRGATSVILSEFDPGNPTSLLFLMQYQMECEA